MKPLNIGTEAAWKKITAHCSYRERTHAEVKEKLYAYGLYKAEVELLISRLIEENYLNEERFAIAYAGGKFRMNDWGRQKIKYHLTIKKLSPFCIKKALSAIDEADYLAKISQLAQRKIQAISKEPNHFIIRQKVLNYLIQKGFEMQLAKEAVEKLLSGKLGE